MDFCQFQINNVFCKLAVVLRGVVKLGFNFFSRIFLWVILAPTDDHCLDLSFHYELQIGDILSFLLYQLADIVLNKILLIIWLFSGTIHTGKAR